MIRKLAWVALGLLVAAPAAAPAGGRPAPVPKGVRPPVACVLTRDATKGPLDDRAFVVELTNHTDRPIDLHSNLPFGVLVFLDVAIEGPDGKRISPEFYDAAVASPFAPPPRHVGTLAVDRAARVELATLKRYVEKAGKLQPGKYRVRVKFQYDKHTAVSDWVTIEIPAGK